MRSVGWIYDSYFSLYRPIHLGGNVKGKCPGGNCPDTDLSVRSPFGLYIYTGNSATLSVRRTLQEIVSDLQNRWSILCWQP